MLEIHQKPEDIESYLGDKAIHRTKSFSIFVHKCMNLSHHLISEGSRKKVQAGKSSNRRKSRTFFLNFFLVHMEAEVLR